jgi:hypothetical protein
MKLSSLATLALVAAIVFSSCKKDDAPAAAPAPYYVGKWGYNTIIDTFYNWQELINNNNVLLDSVKTYNQSTTGYYFEFKADKTFNHNRLVGTANGNQVQIGTGTYTVDSSSTGTSPRFNLLYSTAPADTIKYFITGRSATNLQLNRVFIGLNALSDTLIVDRYWNLIKQ